LLGEPVSKQLGEEEPPTSSTSTTRREEMEEVDGIILYGLRNLGW